MRKLLFLFILSSCLYISKEKDDLSKYPEIADFIACHVKVDSKHYLDRGVIEFYFISEKGNYLQYTDSVALANSWKVVHSGDENRVYSKMLKSFPADETVDTLKVSVKEEKVKIIWN